MDFSAVPSDATSLWVVVVRLSIAMRNGSSSIVRLPDLSSGGL